MLSKQTKENILLGSISLLAILSITTTAYLVDKSLKANLVTRAKSISSLLSFFPIETLQGNESDIYNPQYKTLKQKLTELRRINKDARFVYLVKNTHNQIIFLVDSESTDSSDYSPPGQVYDEATANFRTAVVQGLSGWETSGDRWGRWMSGYAPIYDSETGQYSALIGMDLNYYTNYLFPVLGYSVIPFFVFVIILLIIFYMKRMQDIEEKIIMEKDQLIRIAHHEFGTPVAETGWACEKLLSNEAVRHDPEALFMIRHMYASLNTLVRRTANLLKTIELAVPQPLEKKEVDVVPLIQDAIATHKKIALAKERHIELKQPFPAHARVLGHSSSLQVVFANLIAHSLYYTKEQGTAEIAYTDRGTFHEFSTFSPGDTLKENEVTSLFSAYYKGEKLSSHTQSTGLGLYLIHKIVRLHGGTVSAIPGEEGVFLTVTLPKQQ